MSTSDRPPRSELTDEQLDAVLASTDQELLDQIRSRDDAAATLTAILSDSSAAPGEATSRVPQSRAAELIAQRTFVHRIAITLDECDTRLRALDRALDRDLGREEIEASGADLSHLDIDDLDVLNGAIWTRETIWPPNITYDQMRGCSREISPGTYQVVRDERDRSDLMLV